MSKKKGGSSTTTQKTDYSELERQKELQLEEADRLKRETRAKRINLTRRSASLLGSSIGKLLG